MFDFDARDSDSRDDGRYGSNPSRGSRGASDDCDRDDDWSQPDIRSRDWDDEARTLGRGPGNDRQSSHSNEHARDRRDDARFHVTNIRNKFVNRVQHCAGDSEHDFVSRQFTNLSGIPLNPHSQSRFPGGTKNKPRDNRRSRGGRPPLDTNPSVWAR